MAKVTRERGIDRAIDILDCLHHHRRPMVVNELAAAMGAPRSTIYQTTKLLLNRSVLDSYSGGRVFLGRKLFLYGSAVPEQYTLIELSRPFIDELAEASDMMVLMQVEEGDGPAADAVTLLLQLRRDMEMQLAA